MNERVERFVEYFKNEKEKRECAEKERVLISVGLFDKEYSENGKRQPGYLEYDKETKKYYRKKAIQVTEEEYAEILKYRPKVQPKRSDMPTCLTIFAIISFVGAVLCAASNILFISGVTGGIMLLMCAIINILLDIRDNTSK